MHNTSMHRQVLILAAAQALFQVVSIMVMTIGALAGSQIASSPTWATLPIATMFLGTAIMVFPASLWMVRVGRRVGFLYGSLLGVAGGLVAALGISQASLPMLAFGTFLVGAYQAFAQFYRFAASEVADAAFRPRAISLVMAGGVVAALAGPTLARLGGPIQQPEYLGSFLILAVVSLLATGVLLGLHMPADEPAHSERAAGRPWRQIVAQPTYRVALFGAATGYGIMILAMTATPLAMLHHDHGLGSAATVIQLHVLGMFLPSFITGTLIVRFGVLRIMLVGVLLFIGHILLTLTGTSFSSFASALILLGVGWNFMYIGGTTLLTSTYTPAEKGSAQAINDMLIFAVGLVCSFGAGGLLHALGWQTLNLVLLPWLGLAAASLIWLGARTAGQRGD
ncbi:MAG: MFS transporter [Pseudomonadaceae bacterium]|uniref:MFS transporter n=1 Tax=Pseudomonas sp. Ga0074129 TaxID=1752219 RepID=UPI000A7251BC|nr:MFS transporter [Pseudomonas sp. Ga0074129]MBX9764045.1 MFS transporter [Pseudomonadaceae bacterium]